MNDGIEPNHPNIVGAQKQYVSGDGRIVRDLPAEEAADRWRHIRLDSERLNGIVDLMNTLDQLIAAGRQQRSRDLLPLGPQSAPAHQTTGEKKRSEKK